MRSKYETGREGSKLQLWASLFCPQRLHGFPPIPPFPLGPRGKASSRGVVFEKESTRSSLCIIACSTSVSSPGSKCSRCADPRSSWRWGLLGLQPSGSQLPGADRGCGHTSLFQHCHLLAVLPPSSVLQASSPWLSEARPLNSGRAGSQISLPVCSTEKHIIFLCRDRNVFLIYHPLPRLGLLLESVLFLFFKIMFAILTMFF